jgi:hypothetical protein
MRRTSKSLVCAAVLSIAQPAIAQEVKLNCAPLFDIWFSLDFELSYAYRMQNYIDDNSEIGRTAREYYDKLDLANDGRTSLELIDGAYCKWSWREPARDAEEPFAKISYHCSILTASAPGASPATWGQQTDDLMDAFGKCIDGLDDTGKNLMSVDAIEKAYGSVTDLSRKAIQGTIGDADEPLAATRTVAWSDGSELGHVQTIVGRTVDVPGDPQRTILVLSQIVKPRVGWQLDY